MREPGIGRVLAASLHQGIADVLPTRLAFYEDWLNAEGLRAGTIGVAPLLAVLSFLRLEGEAYDHVVTRAGRYAAEWTVASMPPFERRWLSALPEWLRTRMVLRLGQRLVRDACQSTRARGRVKRGEARVELTGSIFCGVRDRASHPLCGFYAAAFGRLMALFDLDLDATVSSCRGAGAPACVVAVQHATRIAEPAPEVPAA